MMHSNFVQTNGIRVHYLRSGSGQPQVLMLHGITDNGACWTPVIDALGPGYDYIAPDARGHGLSDAPERGYAPQDHANDTAGLIQTLKLDRPVVMGHSMGGAQATLLAAQHPDLVKAVILEDPAWFDSDTPDATEQRRQAADAWRTNLRTQHTRTQDQLIAEEQARNPGWSHEEFVPWAQAKQQARVQALDYVEAQSFDWRAAIRAIQCPVLLITGDVSKGVIISPETAREAQTLNPRVQVVQVKGAGHSIRREGLPAYVAAVRAFLADVTH